jgi:chloramphenicol O-acetyltransferase type A
MKTHIDLNTYPRRSHFEYFRSLAFPYVGLTANVDVTNLIRYAKERRGSPFLAILWAASQAANSVPELRQRIEGEGIVEFDHCDVGHTVALPDHTFCNCYTETRMSLAEFLVDARRRQNEAMQQSGFFNPSEDETGLIFTSCVPWVSFTQVVQPVPSPGDCNPRIVFGKYIQESEKTLMPLHIQCNHALVDGYHISEFFRIFQKINDEI